MNKITEKQRNFLSEKGIDKVSLNKMSKEQASKLIQAILDDDYKKTKEYEVGLVGFDESFY